MNTIYLWDNLLNLDNIENKSINILYIDPPYNTGNIFWYNDKLNQLEWNKNINERVKKAKAKLTKNGVCLFSISEENVFNVYQILKDNFKYVFEPLIWQTKSNLNQNKVSNISSIIHEYILVASDEKIKTNPEKIVDQSIINEKIDNYPLSINLKKDISDYNFEIIENKKIYIIPETEYSIINSVNDKKSFKNHKFQKRTYQKWHGSERYIKYVNQITEYNWKTLYYIDWVNDKQNLGWKFILWNSYFQSISSEIYLKMPSFLWFYQWWIAWFQTAKPIELIKRLFINFNTFWENVNVLDLYTWSWNVIISANELWFNTFWFEIWWIDNKSFNIMKENLKNIQCNFI